MLKAVLIDDEIHCLKALDITLRDYCPNVEVLAKCESAEKGLKAIEEYAPDVVFLDIQMPFMNGFELLQQFTKIPFAVIFTTSYNEYAIKAFRFSALDYLLKPIDRKELITAVTKLQTQKSLPLTEQYEILLERLQNKDCAIRKIPVPTAEGYEFIFVDNILRCEADDNYTYIFLKDKKKMTACRTLKDIEEQLHEFAFFLRVHHSWIVNLNEVTKYIRGDGGYVVMSDETVVNVSRSRKEALLRLLK